MPARHRGHFDGPENARHIVRLVLQVHLDLLAQQIDRENGAVPSRRLHKGADAGHIPDQVFIGLFLIAQAAHQPAAAAGDLGGIEREILHLGHFGGDGRKLVQEGAAAVGAAADPDPAEHLGLVAHADLAQLDAVVKNAREILDQLAEVHAPVGGEEEKRLVAVKAAFHVHKLHVQPVVLDLLLADDQRVLFAEAVLLVDPPVLQGGHTHHRAQRLHHGIVFHKAVALYAVGDLEPLGRLDDDLFPVGNVQAVRGEIIGLSAGFEFYRYYFSQRYSSFFIKMGSKPLPAARTPVLR